MTPRPASPIARAPGPGRARARPGDDPAGDDGGSHHPLQAALAVWSLAVFAAWAALPLAIAPAWPAGWAHLALVAAALLAHRAHVARRNPALLARRRAVGTGTKAWDVAWNALFWPLMASIAVCAALEYRRRGATLPLGVWPAGALLLAAGMATSARAMAVNPFFEATVRVQPDQRVVDAGPYRWVRHPGYLGLVAWAAATPLLLRSVGALPAAGAAAAWIVARTALEDATLRRELPGYREYAGRVRFRLLPGVW